MALLSTTGKSFLVLEPISGRFGIPRLLAKLSSNSLNINWDGEEEITILTVNSRRSRLKILHIDDVGCDLTSRVLNKGTFKVLFQENCIPKALTRSMLERLFIDGTMEGDYQNELSREILEKRSKNP